MLWGQYIGSLPNQTIDHALYRVFSTDTGEALSFVKITIVDRKQSLSIELICVRCSVMEGRLKEAQNPSLPGVFVARETSRQNSSEESSDFAKNEHKEGPISTKITRHATSFDLLLFHSMINNIVVA